MGEGNSTEATDAGIAAATLILFSERDGELARHLMIQRTAQMRFAPEALVFPGGRVDDDDHRIAADASLVDVALADPLELAHRVTAIRETLEEVGVLAGFSTTTALDPAAMQATLKGKSAFSSLLAGTGTRLDLSGIVPWAQWHPRFKSHRQFDTRFYIARHEGDHAVSTDVDEVGHARWLHAHEAIAEADGGRAKIIFPTLCNLERLSTYPTFEAASAHAAAIECRPISPRLDDDPHGNSWISIPEDRGYPVARRLVSSLQAP
ncbi:MAG: NUDIX hydrolase [Novosphingobium sp.]